jgi:hypothetical protein
LPFLSRSVNSLHLRMVSDNCGYNWPSGSEEVENVEI